MTAYNAIPDGDIDPDSPLTTNLVTWLRDNPIAIAEAASGAPSITTLALNPVITAGTAFNVGSIPLQDAGTSISTYAKTHEMVCPATGTIRSEFYLNATGGSTAYGRIYINGVATGTEHSTTTGGTKTDTSIAINKGDLIQIYTKRIGGAGFAYASQWLLKATTANGLVFAGSVVT